MVDKKIDKALYGPSTFEVALGALLGLLVGILAACTYLVFKPVRTVKELPKEPAIGMVYYIPGHTDSTKGRTWPEKQKQLVAGASIFLTEEELNAWGATLNGAPATATPAPAKAPPAKGKTPPPPAKAEEKPAAQPAPTGFFNPSAPNFRMVGDKLQISSKCVLNYFGLTYEVLLVATGDFTKSENHIGFHAEKLYLGSCPIHLLPVLSGPVAARLHSAQKISEDLQVAWEKVTAVSVENGLLKISTAP